MATTAAIVSTPSIPPSTTFLQRCQQELDPSLLRSAQCKEILWKTAALVTVVAFSVLVVGTFAIALQVGTPALIPIGGVVCLLLVDVVQAIHKLFSTWAANATERVKQLKGINGHYQQLSASNPTQIQHLLQHKGIYHVTGMQQNDPNLNALKVLIAHHLFWDDYNREWTTKKQEKLDLAAKLHQESYVDNCDEIYELRSEALDFEQQALEAKVKAAFVNAVIRHPQFTRELNDVGTFSPQTGQERAIGMLSGVQSACHFFTFKSNLSPLTYDQVKELSIADLALRISFGMN